MFALQREGQPGRVKPANHAIAYEAGWILPNGEVRKVARQDFYLLDRDFRQIEEMTGPFNSVENVNPYIAIVIVAVAIFDNAYKCRSADTTNVLCTALDGFHKHVIGSSSSDFEGKGMLSAPEGTY